jgi:hypothetical protein
MANTSSLKPARVQVKVYANDDDTYLVWETAPIPKCRGFAIYRREHGGGEEVLHNKVGWREDKRDPKITDRPSTTWPFQTFTWADFKARAGQVLSYKVVPMVGTDRKHLHEDAAHASAWTQETTVSATDPEGGLAAFFNRGIVSSQWLARALGDPKKAGGKLMEIIAEPGNVTRNFLAGELRLELLRLLTALQNGGGHLFAALYELNDPELLARLIALGPRAHVVLANDSQKTKDPDPFLTERSALQAAHVDLHDRMAAPRFNAHNKFAVFCDAAQKPLAVWTGSTNWSITGLCTQANNGLYLDDASIAAAYKSRWLVLKGAGAKLAPASASAAQFTIGSRPVRVWFSPVKAQKDLADGRAIINGARQGVLFLMFNPGPAPESLLQPILDLVKPSSKNYRPDLYVAGAVNQDPGGKKHPIILVNHGDVMRGPVEIVLPANIKQDFAWWIPELLKAPTARAMVHSKVLVIDPFGHHPVVITGSHNLSTAASGKNDENLVIIENDHALAIAYAINIQTIYKQYRFRTTQVSHKYPGLEDDDTWQQTYMSPRRVQERAFWLQELGG